MQFINRTNNTIYLGDVDKSIPFIDFAVDSIDISDVKKSKFFQQLAETGKIEIVSSNSNDFFERNLLQKIKNHKKKILNEAVEESKIDLLPGLTVGVRGHFYDTSGYSKVNRNLVKGLQQAGINVGIDPVNENRMEINEFEMRGIAGLIRKSSESKIVIDSIIPSFGNSVYAPYRILYTTIESNTIPKQFIEALYPYNEIWVTSDFCKEILEKETDRNNIFVLPDSINAGHYSESGHRYSFDPPLKKFVFLSIFSWNYRKGYDALLRAYLKEFTGDDEVSLLLVTKHFSNPSKNADIKREVADFIKKYGGSNPPHIARCSEIIPESHMPSVYRACSCYILLSRGEGFSLSPIEASLCGLPVISTDHSGHKMFLNKDNSTPVEIDGLKKVISGTMNVHYWDGQYFADLTTEGFINRAGKAMREVFVNYENAKTKNKELSKFARSNYNVKTVGQKAKERIEKIWREHSDIFTRR